VSEATAPDPDEAQRAIEYCYARGWSDGLPLVPVSQPLLADFLARTRRDPDEVIGGLPHVGREVTVTVAAINAAMAGCRPEYFPVVLAAWDALRKDRAASGGGWQSTSGPAPLIVVNGPVRTELGINATGGVFGPGFRANATIARAIGLIVRNGLGIEPQVLEQATQGLPGRWTICLAENEEESPWQPMAVDAGLPAGTSAVSAMLLRTCEYVDNRHTNDPEQVLWDFADTISRTGALIFRDSSVGVVFGPEHAQLLASAGFSKADVQAWFVENCYRLGGDLHRAGKGGVNEKGVRYAADEADRGVHRILPSPAAVPIVVAGARNAAMSMVVRVFGIWSGQSVPVEAVPAGWAAPVEAAPVEAAPVEAAPVEAAPVEAAPVEHVTEVPR
jgi:hypothetical protein